MENSILKIDVNEKGAELDRIYNKETGIDYLWSGDPAFWAKKSPVLFPIVGTLKNDQYLFDGNTYSLSRHGFARDKTFGLVEKNADRLRFRITDAPETKNQFPFSFQFDIVYAISGNQLSVTYEVTNTGSQPLYFSVGGHPAFRVPLAEGTGYEDYYLQCNQKENACRWPISADGLIENDPIPLLEHTDRLNLSKALFSKDALVFKGLKSDEISLRSEKTSHGLSFQFPGFPFLGIWAAKGADFVCIEPWCGIADAVDHNQQLIEKEGINKLGSKAIFSRTWIASFF